VLAAALLFKTIILAQQQRYVKPANLSRFLNPQPLLQFAFRDMACETLGCRSPGWIIVRLSKFDSLLARYTNLAIQPGLQLHPDPA
jgi:hypothetical protein